MLRGRGVSWYAYRDGQRFGPLETRELRANDLVWCPGLEHWTGATDLPGVLSATNVERFPAPTAMPVARRYSHDQVAFEPALAHQNEVLPGAEQTNGKQPRRGGRPGAIKAKAPSYLSELYTQLTIIFVAGLALRFAMSILGQGWLPFAFAIYTAVAVFVALSIKTLVKKHFDDGRKFAKRSVAYRITCLLATLLAMLITVLALCAGLAMSLVQCGYNPFSVQPTFEDAFWYFVHAAFSVVTMHELFPPQEMVVTDSAFSTAMFVFKWAVHIWIMVTLVHMASKLFLPLWKARMAPAGKASSRGAIEGDASDASLWERDFTLPAASPLPQRPLRSRTTASLS
jgi:uncharacterized protein DUF4339